MMFPVHAGQHRLNLRKSAIVWMSILLLLCFSGVALGASGGEHGDGEAHVKGWVATDTYKVINFAVLAAALVYLLRKPMSKYLSDRIKGIQDQLDELEAKKKAAEEELARYNQKFQQLEQESEKIIEQYIQQGEDAKSRIIQEAGAAAEKLQEQARRNIEHEFKKARESLKAEVLEQSLAKAEELLKNKISADDQERLVDEYLEKVVA